MMKAVIQRVTEATVAVDGRTVGRIGAGLLVLLGVAKADTERDADYIVDKLLGLRIFADREGKMNCSVADVGGRGAPRVTIHLVGRHEEGAPAELRYRGGAGSRRGAV